MISTTKLSHNELVQTLAAVFEYNGRVPVNVRLLDAETGKPVQVVVEVDCDSPGLAVRVSEYPTSQQRVEKQTEESLAPIRR